jgi:hypothetical protein
MVLFLALPAFGHDRCRSALVDAACATPGAVAAARAACAPKVRDPACRAALAGDPSGQHAACLEALPPDLAEQVRRATDATPDDRVDAMAELLGSLRDYGREETLIAWLHALSYAAAVHAVEDRFVALELPLHHLTIVVGADVARVLADQEDVPCPGSCDPAALGEVVRALGDRPEWEGIREVLIAAGEDVPYGRVVEVVDAVSGRFPETRFGVASLR